MVFDLTYGSEQQQAETYVVFMAEENPGAYSE